jgi:hypothetical protein
MSELGEAIRAMRDRVRGNLPASHRPNSFHEEKSEIAYALSLIADWADTGRKPEDLRLLRERT